jgi:hypothetical protein
VEARAEFEEAARTRKSPLAFLRLGDFALAEDAPEVAMELWRRARNEFPFGRMVQARTCDLDPSCLKSEERHAIYDMAQAAPAVRADLVVRRARHLVLEGDLMGAVRYLAPDMGPDGACSTVQGWCRRLLLLALQRSGQDGAEALALYLTIPGRTEGPAARQLLELAVTQAERAGAPAFAANMLAAVTGTVAEADLPAHLKRMAGLFVAGGDRARAEEIVLFARTHLDKATWRREGWEALQKSLHRPRPATAAPSTSSPQAPAADADLAAAQAAVEAARLVLLSQGARP